MEALVAARALLRHPLVRVERGTPEDRWLSKLASLFEKACLRLGAQSSRAVTDGPSGGISR